MNITRTTILGVALAIFAGTILVHWPSVQGGFLTRMDDDEYLGQATRLNGVSPQGVRWAFTTTQPYYHPLPRLSFLLDYQLWRTNLKGYHATNVGLHAFNAALLFGFLWVLLGTVTTLTPRERLMLALGVAAVFAIHPLQVESVAWISTRSQLLSTAFGIGCLWAYVAGARRWMVAAFMAAALLSKPTAVSFLFAMLAMDYFPLRQAGRFAWGRLLREKGVFIALAAAAAVTTIFTESHAGGLMETLETVRPSQRIFLAAQSLTFYLWKLVWPVGLSPYYPLGLGFSLRPPLVAASALCVVIVTVLCILYRRRLPALVAGWAAYAMFILPVSGLAQRGWQAAADRYAYVAMVPLLMMAGGAVVWLWRRCVKPARVALACLLVCEFVFLGLSTRAQIPVWHDDESLWRGVLAQFPDSVQANEMLAQTLLNRNRVPEAIERAQHAVAVAPGMAETHMNLGIALEQAGRTPEAVDQFNRALQIKPGLAAAHHNFALTLLRLGRAPEAIAHWEQAVRLQPDYPEAHCNLGIALEQTGKFEEAIGHFERALQARPDYAEAHYNLGVTLARVGRVPDAMGQWEAALHANPDYAEAHCNLGVALEQTGRYEDAVAHYEQALRIRPDLVQAHYNAGVALLRLGRAREAIAHWEQTVRLDPHFAEAYYNRGIALEQLGEVQQAIDQYKQAMKVRPDYAQAKNRLTQLGVEFDNQATPQGQP